METVGGVGVEVVDEDVGDLAGAGGEGQDGVRVACDWGVAGGGGERGEKNEVEGAVRGVDGNVDGD